MVSAFFITVVTVGAKMKAQYTIDRDSPFLTWQITLIFSLIGNDLQCCSVSCPDALDNTCFWGMVVDI
jgi:hypothetical protein